MYRINETSGNLVGIWTDGRLSAMDLEALTQDLEVWIRRQGRLRLLFRVDHFGEWDAAAFPSVARFSHRHEARIERVAIVGDRAWEACVHELLTCLTGLHAHYFLPSELGQAWSWLRNDSPQPAPYDDYVARIRFIKRAQELGFTLDEIEELLDLRATPGTSNRQVKRRAESKIADIEARIRDLERMKHALEELAEQCTGEGSVADCSILHAIETTAA